MFGDIEGLNWQAAYKASFGDLPNKMPYHTHAPVPVIGNDWKSNIYTAIPAMRKSMLDWAAAKGTTPTGVSSTYAGGAGTAGVAMVPVYLDPLVVDTTRKYTPMVEVTQRVTNMGVTADYNKVIAKTSAVWLPEDAALSTADDTKDRASTDIKYLYTKGRVTGQAMAAYPPYTLQGFQPAGAGLADSTFSNVSAATAKQLAVLLRARAMREEEERTIVNGSTSTSTYEFNGIVALQSTTNKLDKSTKALEYADIETAIQYAFDDSGRPNFAIAASSVVGDIRKLMIDGFNYRPIDMGRNFSFGVGSYLTLETMVGPVPVIPQQNLSNTSGSKSIYFLDMNYIEMRVLQDMTYEDLSKTNDADQFMLKIYEALICRNTAFNSWIGGIA